MRTPCARPSRSRLWIAFVALIGTLPATAAPTLEGTRDLRKEAYEHFLSERSTPALAYLSAVAYLNTYGIDNLGLKIKKWVDAYKAAAPQIYGVHDIEFGLYASENLNLYLHSAFWAYRKWHASWALWYPPSAGVAWFTDGQRARGWWANVPLWNHYSMLPNVARLPSGQWVQIDEQGRMPASASAPPDLRSALEQSVSGALSPVALYTTPGSGWIITFGGSSYECSGTVSRELCDHLQRLQHTNQFIRHISFGPNGSWLILYGTNGAYWHDVPDELMRTWRSLVQERRYFEAAQLFEDGSWYIKVRVGR